VVYKEKFAEKQMTDIRFKYSEITLQAKVIY